MLTRSVACSWAQVSLATPKGIPSLPQRSAVKVQASADVPVLAASVPAPEEKKILGVPAFTLKKILLLGAMFFW